MFPNARLAFLKNGGDFPYLSRDAEFTMHVQVHLRNVAHQTLATKEEAVKITKPAASTVDLFLPDSNSDEEKQQEKKEQEVVIQKQEKTSGR